MQPLHSGSEEEASRHCSAVLGWRLLEHLRSEREPALSLEVPSHNLIQPQAVAPQSQGTQPQSGGVSRAHRCT